MSADGYRRTGEPCRNCGRADYAATKTKQRFCSRDCWRQFDAAHGINETNLRSARLERWCEYLDLRAESDGECLRLSQATGGACEFASCRHRFGEGRCSLLVAGETGPQTTVEVAELLGVTKQRVHVIEQRLFTILRRNPIAKRWARELAT